MSQKRNPTPKSPKAAAKETASSFGSTTPMRVSEPATTVAKVHEAKTNLSKLLEIVRHGGRVQIAVGQQDPAFELVLVKASPRGTPRQFGSLRGVVTVDQRFFDPFPADELAAWEQ